MTTTVLAFDVNETSLDLSALDGPFGTPSAIARTAGSGSPRCSSCLSWAG